MTGTNISTGLRLTNALPQNVDADVLAVPIFEHDEPGRHDWLDAATGGELSRMLGSREFTGESYDVVLAPVTRPDWRTRRVAFVGAGGRGTYSTEQLRTLSTAVVLHARRRWIGRLAVHLDDALPAEDAAQASAEGLTLGAHTGAPYKSESKIGPPPEMAIVHARGGEPGLQRIVQRGRILGESCNIARSLADEPGNVLTPRAFADRAASVAAEAALRVEIVDERGIDALNLRLLQAVARGSAEPPRVIVMRHGSERIPEGPVLGLVGKGITFDTGGISLKPADGMERMKDDMAGGAAVIAAMRAIALLDAPIPVVGVVPCAENMPGSRATRPGDVIVSAAGKSVEVVNTDAEGRLILGDALWYVRQLGATHLMDVATLTGACVVALGKIRSGLFGTPEWWRTHVHAVADRAGDRTWPMPTDEEYLDQLRSETADLSNTGGRPAGAVTAAMFLKEFTGGLPWVHMDIAGTAWFDEAKPYRPKGASGVAVRTLAELAFTAESWKPA
jgi:leucyl aminopeptidase